MMWLAQTNSLVRSYVQLTLLGFFLSSVTDLDDRANIIDAVIDFVTVTHIQ
jgi:hypothetical protein